MQAATREILGDVLAGADAATQDIERYWLNCYLTYLAEWPNPKDLLSAYIPIQQSESWKRPRGFKAGEWDALRNRSNAIQALFPSAKRGGRKTEEWQNNLNVYIEQLFQRHAVPITRYPAGLYCLMIRACCDELGWEYSEGWTARNIATKEMRARKRRSARGKPRTTLGK